MRRGRDAMDGLGWEAMRCDAMKHASRARNAMRCDAMKNATRATASEHLQPHGRRSKNTRLAAAPTSSASGRGFRSLTAHAADPSKIQRFEGTQDFLGSLAL